jgi:hypothetical protein
MAELTERFMKDVDADEKDGLLLDVVEMWKGQVLALVKEALEFFIHFEEGDMAAEPESELGPLKRAISAVALLTEAVTKEVQDPSEERLRELTRKLEAARKEVMDINRGLMVAPRASTATEAHQLASKAGEAIKASRETIKVALRGMGAASDILEVSSPTRTVRPPPTRP